jgi:hypothetical protein
MQHFIGGFSVNPATRKWASVGIIGLQAAIGRCIR